MSENQPDTITHHAMLVAWGQFGQSIGLVQAIEAVTLHQKTVEHKSADQNFGVFHRHPGWIEASARTEPIRSSHRSRSGRRQSLVVSRMGRLQWGEPNPGWNKSSRSRSDRQSHGANHSAYSGSGGHASPETKWPFGL